jgi:hypothetical protein
MRPSPKSRRFQPVFSAVLTVVISARQTGFSCSTVIATTPKPPSGASCTCRLNLSPKSSVRPPMKPIAILERFARTTT